MLEQVTPDASDIEDVRCRMRATSDASEGEEMGHERGRRDGMRGRKDWTQVTLFERN